MAAEETPLPFFTES